MSSYKSEDETGNEKPDLLDGAPCERALHRFEEAVSVLEEAYTENRPPRQLFTDLLTKGARLSANVSEYLTARKNESEEPYLNKDYPRMHSWTQKPRRVRAGNDAVHQAEHKVSLAMHDILNDFEEMPRTQEVTEQYREAAQSIRALADVLTVMGVYLDQGTEYAAKGTMPKGTGEEDLVPSKPKGHQAFYTRLNKLAPPPRMRGVE